VQSSACAKHPVVALQKTSFALQGCLITQILMLQKMTAEMLLCRSRTTKRTR